VAAEAPAALRAEEGCNPPPAILPDTPGAGITAWAIIAGVIAEIIPGIIAEIIAAFTRPSFPCCKGRRIRLPGAASISTKRSCRTSSQKQKSPLPEFVPAGVKS